MSETLWITLPTNEENELKAILNLIVTKNLDNLSINQLIEKIKNHQAQDWLEVLGHYNSITSINNINLSQILTRAINVKNKFDRENSKNGIIYPLLKNQVFTPNQLLGLIILCYSNPNLIGPKLCKALNDNNEADIKKEILENSSYVRAQNRVVPWTLNLRLANYALYANDTSVRLPVAVINRVKNETIQYGRTVHLVDQRGGFDEWVNGTERAVRSVRAANDEIKLDSYQILQSLQSDEQGLSDNSQFITTLPSNHSLPQVNDYQLTNRPSSDHNAANSSNGNSLIMGSLIGFHVFRNLPIISPVLRNVHKDIVTAASHIGSFFSKHNPEHAEQLEQKTPPLSAVIKP